jgi:ABC-type multidrug transport system ATPase subunit
MALLRNLFYHYGNKNSPNSFTCFLIRTRTSVSYVEFLLFCRTDGIIRDTIRERFERSTMLIIAHRLETVMEVDLMIVLDGGRIVVSRAYTLALELTQYICDICYGLLGSSTRIPVFMHSHALQDHKSQTQNNYKTKCKNVF